MTIDSFVVCSCSRHDIHTSVQSYNSTRLARHKLTFVIILLSNSLFFCVAVRPTDDRKRQEQLGKERLVYKKGRKLPRDWKGEDLKFSSPGEAGLVDVFEDTVRALERKHAMERELLIYLLQGRESAQARSAAKKLSAGI